MKLYELDPDDKFRLAGDDNSPVFTYLGNFNQGFDHYTAEDEDFQKHYFDSELGGLTPVIRVKDDR